MAEPQITIRVFDLPRIEALELREKLGTDHVRLEEPAKEGEEHGDLGTVTAVVVLGLAALKLLAVALPKTRRTRRIRLTLDQEDARGARTRSEIEIEEDSSKPLGPDALKQLAAIFEGPGLAELEEGRGDH
jgi:hypothetical protein